MPANNPTTLVPRHELLAIVIAALVLLIVLVASYMCLVLYGEKSAGPCPPSSRNPAPVGSEGFLGNFSYNPVCGGSYCDSFRKNCHGFTSGAMPAIESEWSGGGLCSGLFTDGVPP